MTRGLLRGVLALLALLATPALAAPSAADREISIAKDSMRGDPAITLAHAQRAATLAAQLPDGAARMQATLTAEWLQGEAYIRLNDVDRAKPLIDQALKALAGVHRPLKLKADLLVSRGYIDMARANVAAALADFQAAFAIYHDLGEARSQSMALQSIASLYREGGDYQTALKYYGQAEEVYRGDPGMSVSTFNNRGNVLHELKRNAEATIEYRKALHFAVLGKSPLLQARILGNIARGLVEMGKLGEADTTLAAALAIARDKQAQGFRPQLIAIAAFSAFQHNDLARAKVLIAQAFRGVDLQHTQLPFREAHDYAYQIYSHDGEAPLALAHLTAMKRLDDETAKLAASANTALMAARFDYTNQNLKIAKLRAEELQRSIDYQRTRAKLQRTIFLVAAAATAVLVALLAFGIVTLRRSRNEVRAANVDLGQSNTALAKALAAKTEFLATTSHEIRTPLNGILGMTQVMLADPRLDPMVRDRVTVVHGAGISMRALVDDILDVAKMETGNLSVETIPFDLRATLGEVSRLWQEQARAKGLGFELTLDDCPPAIEGDPARLRQVVFNLLSNALKFTEAGVVRLSAHAESERLRIAVRDSGIGIPADKQDLIFESFRQADGGTTRRFGGTGLGLSICRNLARAMGGDILLTSEEGRGSTFTLDLPLRAIEPPAVEDPQAPADTLLIVDRNPITRAMLKALFAPRVPNVAFAASIEEAAGQGARYVLIDEATARTAGDGLPGLERIAAERIALLWTGPDGAVRQCCDALGVSLIEKPIAGAALAARFFDEAEKLAA